MNYPRLSIIIATYNSGKTINTALRSVMEQDYQDWECIIVDGASKDDTIEIVKEYETKDSRFRHISEPDRGIYDAFNKGWRLARGEWIHYLGSDDSLTKEGMAQVAKELDENYAVVTGDVYIHKIDNTIKPQLCEGFRGCHQGVLMQRKVFDIVGGFDEKYKIMADYELLLRVANSGFSVKNVRSFLAFFTMGGESQRIKTQWQKMWERYHINKKYHTVSFPLYNSLYVFGRSLFSSLYRMLKKAI